MLRMVNEENGRIQANGYLSGSPGQRQARFWKMSRLAKYPESWPVLVSIAAPEGKGTRNNRFMVTIGQPPRCSREDSLT
jgi:hypothetical protein